MMILNAVTLFILGTFVGNFIAIGAFVHPRLYSLTPEAHRPAARAIAAVYGRALPVWYSVSLLLLIAVSALSHAPLAILATLIFLVTLICTIVWLGPLNKKIASWDLNAPPAEWLDQRVRWDRWHRLRVIGVAISFALLCVVIASGEAAAK